MSVFGGDSWDREAQYRKRRVDDLMIEGIEASSYKKLSNGKFACLICPKNPVLDTPMMLSTHVRGSRHRANEVKHKDKEFSMREEVNKRLAWSNGMKNGVDSNANHSIKQRKTNSTPLIEKARKAAMEVVCGEVSRVEMRCETSNVVLPHGCDFGGSGSSLGGEPSQLGGVLPLDFRKRREMELKFTAAGWKRDCHGNWFKDENVEFDSDEEDPNIVLNNTT